MVLTLRRALPALLSVSLIYACSATAQNYPNRSIRIVIPFAAGGATDVVFRMLTPPLSEHLGQQVVIDNRPGRLIGLGVSSLTRDPALPDVPSIAEAGVPGYEFFDWQGVVAPAGTPGAVIGRLHQEIVKALGDPELRKRIAGVGASTVGSTPQELGAFIKKQLATWSTVVKAAGIRID